MFLVENMIQHNFIIILCYIIWYNISTIDIIVNDNAKTFSRQKKNDNFCATRNSRIYVFESGQIYKYK